MRAQITNRDYEQLSAYIDGQLSSPDQKKLEERLHARPDLQNVLEDLKRTKMLLRMAPHRRAPRNFTLTPAMIGGQINQEKRSFLPNLFPVLSFASAIAVFALIASFLFEFLPSSVSTRNAGREAQAVAMQPAADLASEATAGPLIQAEQERSIEAAPEAAEPAELLATTPEMGEAETPAQLSEQSTGETGSAAPPVINWQSPVFGMGGGGSETDSTQLPGEYAPAPKTGFGGGAGGGGGGGFADQSLVAPDGSIVVPLEGINSLTQTQPAEESVQLDSSRVGDSAPGGGPILGIPSQDESGTIRNKSAWGEPLNEIQQPFVPELEPSSGIPAWYLQIALAVFAVTTGAAALIMRRRNAG